MAGIFANVDSDITKLRSLKAEIENVKKALKSINVKVDIDIAKGLEARLKSLSEQYDALVTKVSEAEGKIMISTKRINDAAEKIIKVQEQMSKSTGISPVNNDTTNTTANMDTASVQMQVKAYDDLANEINSIIGTREQNIKRMLEEQNAIRLINAEIKQLTKYQLDNQTLSNNQQKRLEQLNNSLLTHKAALAEVRQTLSNNAKLDNAAATSMDALSQSLGRMRTTYRQLTEEERNSPFGRELLASINQADAKIKALDATIGNHQRNVGNYASGWNGLNMSIQQVGRELPSLAVSWNTFFLAISNNLPILADEIKRAKEQYNALKNSGEKAVPVWKQVVSSIFSWQSALTVGITLLTLYGGRVVDWISGLLGADSAQKRLNESVKEFNSIISKEETNVRVLFDAIKKTNEGTRGRADAIKKINDSYGKYLPYLLSEKSSLLEIEQAYKNVNKALMENAALKAQKNAIDKVVEESLKVQSDALSEIQKGAGNKNSKAITDIVLGWTEDFRKAGQTWQQAFNAIAENIQKRFGKMPNGFYGALEDYIKSVYESNREISKIQEKYNPFFNEGESNKAIIENKEYWETQKKVAEENLAKISSSQKKAMDAGNFKGIDADVVKSYKDNVKKLKEAEKELKVYDSFSKQQKEADKQLKQQEKLAEDLLSLRRKNQQDEINLMADGTEKKLAQIDLDYQKELDAIRKQEQEWSKANGGKLTKEQSVQISLSYSQAENKRDKSISDVNKEELEAMNRYLKEYGTFQQKRDAITKEYNNKIAKATTEGDKKMFQKEMEEALSSVDMDKLKQEINWELIFGDLNKVSKKSLEQVKQQLKAFKSSDEYKNMAVDQKKVIDEALNNIQSTIIDKGGLLGDLPEQLDALRIAQDELKQAQDEYNKSLKSGTDAEKEAALKKKSNAEKNVQNAEANVTRSADKTKQNLITLADTITQLGSSSEISLSQIGNIASGLVDAFSEAGSKIGGIIGAVFSLLDGIEKQGFDGFVENIFSSVFRTAASIWDTITFGAFSKITGSGDSDKTLERDIEYLTQSNQDLKNSLDNLSEKMDKASVTDASDIYEVQRENILKQEANTLEAMQRSAAAYSNGFWGMGGSHSSNNKIDKGISASEWSRVSDIVGKSVSNAGQFFQLSSEQMSKLAEEDTSLYSKIKNLADDGYKNAAQYMDEYITYYKQLEELENAYNEKLTNTSFDNVRNDFKNVLLDMESDAEDFANDFEKMMQNAIVESLMTKKYDKLIQDWYGEFAEAMKSGGKIDEIEQGNLQNRWNSIVNQALAERDALKEMMGWESESDSTREASQKGIATASQDSVDENNGRLAVMQGHTYSINENVSRMATGIDGLLNYSVANLSATTDIDKTAKAIESQSKDILNHLANIDNYTSNLVEIREYMYAMKSGIDTLNTKGITLKR